MKIDAISFWNRFDSILEGRGINLKEFSQTSGVPYDTMVTQRVRKSVPKLSQLLDMAHSLDSSVEYLMTGSSVEDPLSALLMKNTELKDTTVRLTYCNHVQLTTVNMLLDTWGIASNPLGILSPARVV
ncbi:MAG: hypothetical protein PWP59_1784 [Sphaerochaeta sp.]|jgi:hypothetical protein|nr:hypothetical protein [Sphaerochaeta sp.]